MICKDNHRSLPDFLGVELKLLALENVSVAPAGLTGPAGDAGKEFAGEELLTYVGVNGVILIPLV